VSDLGYGDVVLPETEFATTEVLSLPVHPALSLSDLETIVSNVNEFMEKNA
jgi:dTDP-4-amino-4,6-dideoxygalactose transaminase